MDSSPNIWKHRAAHLSPETAWGPQCLTINPGLLDFSFQSNVIVSQALVHNKFCGFGVDDEKSVSKNGLHSSFKPWKILSHAGEQFVFCIRNLLMAVCLGKFMLVSWGNTELLKRDSLQSASLYSRLKSSSFTCRLLFSCLLMNLIYWYHWLSWDEYWDLWSPGPVFHSVAHVVGLGYCLLYKELPILRVFYELFSYV